MPSCSRSRRSTASPLRTPAAPRRSRSSSGTARPRCRARSSAFRRRGPPINDVSITDGHDFDARHVEHRSPSSSSTPPTTSSVAPGTTVEALGLGNPAPLDVVGVGLSPEYLLPAQSQQQVVTTPGSFAVLFVPRVRRRVTRRTGDGAPGARAVRGGCRSQGPRRPADQARHQQAAPNSCSRG